MWVARSNTVLQTYIVYCWSITGPTVVLDYNIFVNMVDGPCSWYLMQSSNRTAWKTDANCGVSFKIMWTRSGSHLVVWKWNQMWSLWLSDGQHWRTHVYMCKTSAKFWFEAALDLQWTCKNHLMSSSVSQHGGLKWKWTKHLTSSSRSQIWVESEHVQIIWWVLIWGSIGS